MQFDNLLPWRLTPRISIDFSNISREWWFHQLVTVKNCARSSKNPICKSAFFAGSRRRLVILFLPAWTLNRSAVVSRRIASEDFISVILYIAFYVTTITWRQLHVTSTMIWPIIGEVHRILKEIFIDIWSLIAFFRLLIFIVYEDLLSCIISNHWYILSIANADKTLKLALFLFFFFQHFIHRNMLLSHCIYYIIDVIIEKFILC